MTDTLRARLDAILERTAQPPTKFGTAAADVHVLERPDPGREHDLPPRWDGCPVVWEQWSIIRTTLRLHMSEDHFACPRCGTIDEDLSASGRAMQPDDVAGYPLALHLYATRCMHCAHDQVYVLETDELFDLEASDYGAEGSS